MAFFISRRLLNHPPRLTTAAVETHNSHLLHLHYSELDDKNFKIHGHTLFYLFILFSLTLLVTLLLLYARWYFRFRHLNAPPPLHAQPAAASKGLDEAAIKAMPILLHQKSGVEREEEMECCICLGVFDDGDKVKVLSECRHRFHSDCVDRWLVSQPTCPLCRVSLKPSPPSDLDVCGEA